jgi:hypothetical protein
MIIMDSRGNFLKEGDLVYYSCLCGVKTLRLSKVSEGEVTWVDSLIKCKYFTPYPLDSRMKASIVKVEGRLKVGELPEEEVPPLVAPIDEDEF